MTENTYYTKEHEWVKLDGDEAVIGITSHAANALGDITFIETPEVGTIIEQAKQCGTIESIKAVSDLYAPINGTISAINSEIESAPELVNQSPQESGWICKIIDFNEEQVKSLMNEEQYKEYLETQVEK